MQTMIILRVQSPTMRYCKRPYRSLRHLEALNLLQLPRQAGNLKKLRYLGGTLLRCLIALPNSDEEAFVTLLGSFNRQGIFLQAYGVVSKAVMYLGRPPLQHDHFPKRATFTLSAALTSTVSSTVSSQNIIELDSSSNGPSSPAQISRQKTVPY